jgi:hypothetical protein
VADKTITRSKNFLNMVSPFILIPNVGMINNDTKAFIQYR